MQFFEFVCAMFWWFLSVRHLKWMNSPNFEQFLKIYPPRKSGAKFLAKNKLCGQKRDMNEIETCPFAVLLSLVMPMAPPKDFLISWKMAPDLSGPFLSYHSMPKPQKLIFLLKFGMQVKFSTSNRATIFWPIWALTSVLKAEKRPFSWIVPYFSLF